MAVGDVEEMQEDSSCCFSFFPFSLLYVTEPVRSAYQPPDSSTFLSERTSHQQPAATSQQYSSLRTNQHQPSATSQPNRLQAPSQSLLYYGTVKTGKDLLLLPGTSTVRLYIGTVAVVTVI
jgi:hypothetical protein